MPPQPPGPGRGANVEWKGLRVSRRSVESGTREPRTTPPHIHRAAASGASLHLPANDPCLKARSQTPEGPEVQSHPTPAAAPNQPTFRPVHPNGRSREPPAGNQPARPSSSDNRAIRRNPRPNVVRYRRRSLVGRRVSHKHGMTSSLVWPDSVCSASLPAPLLVSSARNATNLARVWVCSMAR